MDLVGEAGNDTKIVTGLVDLKIVNQCNAVEEERDLPPARPRRDLGMMLRLR